VILALSVASLSIWIYLTLAHGGFWRVKRLMPAAIADLPAEAPEPFIVAIIPARDEADVIPAAVPSLLQQSWLRLHLIVVDDGSTDGTARAARETASAIGAADRLTVIQGRALPPGWSGKLWALHQGIEAAREFSPDFFLLADADVVHAPGNLRALASLAETGNYDMASLMVKLHCSSLAERALIPAFVFFFLMLYPPAWIADPRRKTAGAAGGCILIRPQALWRAGGMEAIRGEIIDDCALARRVKLSGGHLWLGLACQSASIRPYTSFGNIGRMISRAAFNQLRHSTPLLVVALLGLAVTYVAPPMLLLARQVVPAALAICAWLLMALSYLSMVRFYRLNPLWSFALPAIALFYMGCTLHSAFKFWSGRGGEWKGRVQDRS
jgi:hopene-associated glycosyltransferase HpnB